METGEDIEIPAKFTLSPPNFDDMEELDNYIVALSPHHSNRGVLSLGRNLANYIKWQRLLECAKIRALKNISVINGNRSSYQRKGDRKRSLRYVAQEFYGMLSTPELRKQCELFKVDYESYESVEEIVEALTQKHLDMMRGSVSQ